jgi:hypothetical protein
VVTLRPSRKTGGHANRSDDLSDYVHRLLIGYIGLSLPFVLYQALLDSLVDLDLASRHRSSADSSKTTRNGSTIRSHESGIGPHLGLVQGRRNRDVRDLPPECDPAGYVTGAAVKDPSSARGGRSRRAPSVNLAN